MGEKSGIESFDLRSYDEETEKSRAEEREARKEADESHEDDNTTASQKAGRKETVDELERRTEQSTDWLNTDPALTEE